MGRSNKHFTSPEETSDEHGRRIGVKFYVENTMGQLRLALEGRVLRWPQIRTKKMFGCPSYLARQRLFAFLVTNGIVLTELPLPDRDAQSLQAQVTPFQAGKRTVRDWLRIPVRNVGDLERIMTFVRSSYDAALRKA